MTKRFDYNSIPGDYHYVALTKGNRFMKFWHIHKIEIIKKIMPLDKNDIILDVGCGSGNSLFELNKNFKLAYGTEVSESAIKFIKKRAKTENIKNVKAIKVKNEKLPFNDSEIDKIIITEVAEHLKDPAPLIRECYRVLKPGGLLFATTPDYFSYWPLIEFINDLFNITTPKIKEAQHLTKFNRVSFKEFFIKNKFKILKYGSFYFISPFISIISKKLASRIFEWEIKRAVKINIFSGMILFCLVKKEEQRK